MWSNSQSEQNFGERNLIAPTENEPCVSSPVSKYTVVLGTVLQSRNILDGIQIRLLVG